MGDYATPLNVTGQLVLNNATKYVIVSDDILDEYIDAKESDANGALKQLDYTIPLTGTADVALLKRKIVRAVVADLYQEQYPFMKAVAPINEPSKEQIELHMVKADALRKQGERWQKEWELWLQLVASGEIIMPTGDPTAPTKGQMGLVYVDLNLSQEATDERTDP